ncbi:hypothetical protein QTP70_028513, partial [Hemibagrus guttatus]
GNVVGHENIVSASRMNSAIVVFLNDVEKVRKLTQNGIVVNNETILVSPLSSPDKKVMLCNVPPFISDEAIGKELSRYGRMVSPIKKIPLGCKSPLDILLGACPVRQSDPGVSERLGQDSRAGRGHSPCGRGPAGPKPQVSPKPSLQPRSPLELRRPRKSHARPNRPWQSHARLARTGRSRGLLRKAQWLLERCWSRLR